MSAGAGKINAHLSTIERGGVVTVPTKLYAAQGRETPISNTCKPQWERLRIELRLRDYEPHVRPLHYPPYKCLGLDQDPGGPVLVGVSEPWV